MKIAIAGGLFISALCALLWWQNGHLNLALSAASQQRIDQQQYAARLQTQLDASTALATDNEQAQVALHASLSAAAEHARQQDQTIMRLLNENNRFREWYRAELPVDVRQLHQRAACASAGDCQQPLSVGQPVPNARQPTGEQR